MTTVGVISDTHGLLRPEAIAALQRCALILHAGDIGSLEVLEQLGRIAPVMAIRGNNDTASWARSIPPTRQLQIERTTIYMLHDLKELDIGTAQENIHVVIAGHSHRPSIERRDGTLFLNPGSAGPRRFNLPITVAKLTISGSTTRAKIVELKVESKRGPKKRGR